MTKLPVSTCLVRTPEGPKVYVTVDCLSTERVFERGLPPEIIVGVLPGPVASVEAITPAFFAQNRVFVDFMHGVIARRGPESPGLIAAARQQGDGLVYVVDQRTRTPQGASQKEVIGPSGSGPDANYAGVYSTWRHGPNDRTLAIYHGENWDGMGVIESGVYGAMWSINLALIDPASGRVERKGEILRSDEARQPVNGPHPPRMQGVGEPSMTADRDGRYLLCYYTKASRPKFNICVARSPIQDEGAIGTWKKFYQGYWDEPGLGGHQTPVLTAEGADVGQCFVTYVKEWERYIIVFCLLGYKDWETGQLKQSGVYMATSRNGVRWTAPERVMAALVVQKPRQPVVQHPTLVDTSVTKSRLQGRLFHAYSPRWPIPHSLAASPITIQFKRD